MNMRLMLLVLAIAVVSGARGQTPGPGPNRADEPMATAFSLTKAAEFLDTASRHWTEARKCGACHTNYAHLMARSSLREVAPVPVEIRKFFETRAANWETEKPRWDTEVVATAVALAFDDRQTGSALHPLTRKALDWMWRLQRDDGSWNWLKCDWPPAESDDYYGVCFAAIGVGNAPEGYARTDAAQPGLAKIRNYLKTHAAPNAHHRLMLLWASLNVDGLLDAGDRAAIVAEARTLQRPDGGWSVRTLWGERKRRDGTSEDLVNPESDAYATGLVLYLLRQTGIVPSDPALQRGVAWLKHNQRASGRWFVRSLTTDNAHYLTHMGSAYAVLGLKACE